ncbi:spore protease YyaC [Paenibacillus xerothermodurans]|uniref:Spore protease YyaC n=1 Tax=Paenibacillus xerothermodurans TaxID=1977292 RepID=A0A2W1N9W0_PAEXE|nr:spore protease YyaC [Paenibacillus xerothermodurans]PZE20714.1 spore protease YyaC [Paenibacillus xerothermodurans]
MPSEIEGSIAWNERGAAQFRKRVSGAELPSFLRSIQLQGLGTNDLLFLCIGTDRSTGDALGPMVGTMLQEAGHTDVIGTLEYPLDAGNFTERITQIPPGKKVIAIDACLGQPASLMCYQVSNQPLEPGKSMNRQLPTVGDYSIAAIVNVDSGNKYSILQSTSLYRVISMAKEIVTAVQAVFPCQQNNIIDTLTQYPTGDEL